ncbi:MAG: 4Fe-4S binding protein [Clostridia bacterium]|nr:4Fe-4S binding protein [Clostridia bacterium]
MALSRETVTALKGRGFLRNRGTDCFSGHVVTAGGVYTADDLYAIAECAKIYGNGKVSFTSRQSAEIVGIPAEHIDEAEAFLRERHLSFGGTGARVRPITACKGTTCVFGNMDTQALAARLHERFYLGMREVTLPHKLKIGIGGCPNSCMKPSLNDIGIEARVLLSYDESACRGCPACAAAAACRSGAILRGEDGFVTLDPTVCRSCGLCVGRCPFGAFPKERDVVCLVTVGGTWGKTRRDGTPLSFPVYPEEVEETLLAILLFYRKNGFKGERLGTTVDRLGIAALEGAIRDGSLLAEQEAILAAPLCERTEAAP